MARLARDAGQDDAFRQETIAYLGHDPSVETIEAWIRVNFMYRGETTEVVRTPPFMLDQFEREGFFEGDCDDVTTLIAALLICYGYPASLVAIRFDSPEFEHVFVETVGGSVIDPTVEPWVRHVELERMVVHV